MFYKTKNGCRFGEKCSYAHRQVDEQPTKRSKKNDDKSAVAMLKKGDWHESESVVNYGYDQGNLARNVITNWNEDLLDVNHLTHGNWLCISRHEAAETYSPEEHKHAETNPTCKIHEGYCASH